MIMKPNGQVIDVKRIGPIDRTGLHQSFQNSGSSSRGREANMPVASSSPATDYKNAPFESVFRSFGSSLKSSTAWQNSRNNMQ